jgi:hypothetical protein
MADNSNQGFLNTLFQWTVKSTAAEAAASPTTTSNFQPMDEEVSTDLLRRISIDKLFFFREKLGSMKL